MEQKNSVYLDTNNVDVKEKRFSFFLSINKFNRTYTTKDYVILFHFTDVYIHKINLVLQPVSFCSIKFKTES